MISFILMVRLIGDALLEHEQSGRQSLLRAEEREEVPSSIRAVYGKPGRIVQQPEKIYASGSHIIRGESRDTG